MRSRTRPTRSLVVSAIAALALVVAAIPAAAAAEAPPDPFGARLVVSRHEAMADEGIRIGVAGLAPGQLAVLRLTVVAGAMTRRGIVPNPRTGNLDPTTFASAAAFRADAAGRVDLTTQPPVLGTYSGVDPMGLFWSVQPTFMPPADPDASDLVERTHLDLTVDGRHVDETDLVLDYLRPGDRVRPVVDEPGLVGTLFAPAGGVRHPAVLVLPGSEAVPTFADAEAALLASHGYVALSLPYFGVDGLPPDLSNIPLEYFGHALDWLAHQPSVDPERLGVLGGSRGGELALLLGTRFPQLKVVVASAPSSVVWSGLNGPDSTNFAAVLGPAWTEHGQPVPFLVPDLTRFPDSFAEFLSALHSPAAGDAAIPVERIDGPVLLLNGADDRLWPSPEMSEQVLTRLRANGHPYPDELHSYPGTGHVIVLPGLAATGTSLGGTPPAIAKASRAAWSTTLRFLDQNLACASRLRTGSPLYRLLGSLRQRLCVFEHRIAAARHGG